MFFFVLTCDTCNFADGKTMYSCNKLLSKILANLCFDLKNVLMWFTVNSLNPNSGKFQYIILGKYVTNQLSLFINGIKIEITSEVVLLGIRKDNQLTFKTHIEKYVEWLNINYAITKDKKLLSTEKARFISYCLHSQFYYAPLIYKKFTLGHCKWFTIHMRKYKKFTLGHCKWFTIHMRKYKKFTLGHCKWFTIHMRKYKKFTLGHCKWFTIQMRK